VNPNKETLTVDAFQELMKQMKEFEDLNGPMGEIRASNFIKLDELYLIDSDAFSSTWLKNLPPGYYKSPRYVLLGHPETLEKLGIQPGIVPFPKSLIEAFHKKREDSQNADRK